MKTLCFLVVFAFAGCAGSRLKDSYRITVPGYAGREWFSTSEPRYYMNGVEFCENENGRSVFISGAVVIEEWNGDLPGRLNPSAMEAAK